MAYRTFMFLPKGNCCDINAIKDYLDPFCSNKKKIDFALSTLEEFDSKSVVKEITEILQDKAKCFDSYPPANFRQVPMVKTVTSYGRAQEVLPSLFAVAAKYHLFFYDEEKDRVFDPSEFVDLAFINRRRSSDRICKAVLQKWNHREDFWHICHVYETKRSSKMIAYHVISVKKKRISFEERVQQFYDILKDALIPGEQLICENKRFVVDGGQYANVYYLEGYKRANLLGYMEKGKPAKALMYRMGTDAMMDWLNHAREACRNDVFARLETQEMEEDYEDLLDRLAASIRLEKQLLKLPVCVGISASGTRGGDHLCFYVHEDRPAERSHKSMLLIHSEDSLILLQFIDDICPYLRERFYADTMLPIEYLQTMVKRLKEVKAQLIENPMDPALAPYFATSYFTRITQEWVAENRSAVIKLFDVFNKWAEEQISLYASAYPMIVISGP